MLKQLLSDLEQLHNAEVAQNLSWFFKTGKGDYGYGDKFVGITVPQIRALAKNYSGLAVTDIKKLAASKIHEYRFCALAILVRQFEKLKFQDESLFNLYMQLMDEGRINNWDLVDMSAGRMGRWLVGKPKSEKLLLDLAKHSDLWHQRLAIMFTSAYISQSQFEQTLKISRLFLTHPHDLIHKATGWMLREVGKRDLKLLLEFLDENASRMPRTMLRYAIEKLPERQRKNYLAMKAQPPRERGR